MLNQGPLRLAVDQDALHHAAESDVLRFVGTLALCLMLLFSVDQSFNQTPAPAPVELKTAVPIVASTKPLKAAPPLPAITESPVPVPASPPQPAWLLAEGEDIEPSRSPVPAEVTRERSAAEAPPAESGGPSLYFASDVVFLSLLTQRRIDVYLRRGSTWSRVTLERDTATPVTPPALYRLRQDTVPELLRRRLTPTDPSLTVEWGVRLTQELETQVQALLAQASGVDVIIEGSGKARTHARDRQGAVEDGPQGGAHDGSAVGLGQHSVPPSSVSQGAAP